MEERKKYKYLRIENFNRPIRFYQINHEWIAKWQLKSSENIDWRGIKIKGYRIGVEECLICPITEKILKVGQPYLFLGAKNS